LVFLELLVLPWEITKLRVPRHPTGYHEKVAVPTCLAHVINLEIHSWTPFARVSVHDFGCVVADGNALGPGIDHNAPSHFGSAVVGGDGVVGGVVGGEVESVVGMRMVKCYE